MPITMERGVIRKIYRARASDQGWCAVLFIQLDSNEIISPIASSTNWPLHCIASFEGNTVEIVTDSAGKHFLLPFMNQHQTLLPPLVALLSEDDPLSFMKLPLIIPGQNGSSNIHEATAPIKTAMKCLEAALNEQQPDVQTSSKRTGSFLSDAAKKHLGSDSDSMKKVYREKVLATRQAIKKKRNQEAAQNAEIRDALLKSILKSKFLSRTGAKVRMEFILYLNKHREQRMDPGEVISVVQKLLRKYSGEDKSHGS